MLLRSCPHRFFIYCHRRRLEPSGIAMLDPNQSFYSEDKPQNFERMQGRNTNDSHDAVQHPSSAVPNLFYDSEFASISESVDLTRRFIGKMKSMFDLSPRTMESPEAAGSPSENPAHTSSSQHGNFLEVNSPTAGTVTSVHTSSNDDNAFDDNGIEGVISSGMSQDFCRRTISKMKTNDVDLSLMAVDISQPAGPHIEVSCYTNPLKNAFSLLANMKKHTEQGDRPLKVNSEILSRDVHAVSPAISEPDSESTLKETQDVNQGAHPSPHYLYMSSHVISTAGQLQGVNLPTQLGKRKLTSIGMYHTQPRSHPNKGRWSGNSNRSRFSQKMKPFDICECSLDVSSFPKSEEVLVKKHVTDDTSEILRPGMVLLKNYIPLDDQVQMVRLCRRLGLGEGGFYQPRFDGGAKLRLQMMCLGLDWDPQTKKYGEMRRLDGARPPALPFDFISLTKKAIEAAHDLIKADLSEGNAVDILPHMHPNICIVNFYNASGRLGLHQDKDESRESLQKGLPVVSISLGDSALFLYGDERDIDKAEQVLLESGDVLIFGGSSRHIFHGVDSIIPDSAPAAFQLATKLRPGRLNLTFREF